MNSILENIKNDKQLIILIFITTFSLGLMAHAHAYLNLFLNHDSLWINHNQSYAFLEMHGRFFIRFWSYITGGLTIPFINGIYSLLFICLASYFVIKTLDFQKKSSQVFVCAIFATAPILTQSNAIYVFMSDIFMLALFLSVLSVFIFKRFNFILGIPLLVCGLGLYQSYIQVAAVLLLILLIKDIFDGCSPKLVLIAGLKAFVMLLSSMIIYYIIIKYFNPQELGSYRGYNTLGNYSDLDIILLFKNTYITPLALLFKTPQIFTSTLTTRENFLVFINITLLIVSLFCLTYTCIVKKINKLNIFILMLIILVMPFSMGFIQFIARSHPGLLAFYAIYCFFILVLFSLESYNNITKFSVNTKINLKPYSIISIVIFLCLTFNVHSNIILANQVYTYKDLNYIGSLSLMTRVVERMEQTPGYDFEKNEVLFLGRTAANPNYSFAPLHQTYDPRKQIIISSTVTYAYSGYFSAVLGVNIKSLYGEKVNELSAREDVKSMPIFPDKDSIQMIDGVLVVKISKN